MGQQISAAAENVGTGAATSAGGLAYAATSMASSQAGGLAAMSLGLAHSGETTSPSRGEANHLGSPTKQQQLQHHQPTKTTWTAAQFESLRAAYPPLPKLASVSTATSPSAGNSIDLNTGVSRNSDQGDSQQGSEMELGKMSIREAIDSFIERCLHNSNDGGASDNESSEESLNSHHSKATAGNIFALDSSSKRSPSSSCHSPATSSSAPSVKREKGRASGVESRTSRDSESSSSSPKPMFDRGDGGRPLSRSLERRDSLGDSSKEDKTHDEVKPSVTSELVMRVDPSLDEGEDTVLVIDCEREDEKDSKGNKCPGVEGDGKSSPLMKRESVTPKLELKEECPIPVKDEPKSEFLDSKRVKHELVDAETVESPRPKSLSEKESSESSCSPSQQSRGNLLMFELSKKAGVKSSSSPTADTKSVRPTPFLPGPEHLQFIIDRVLDSTLNESSDSPKTRTKEEEEPSVESEKKVSSPKDTESKVEIIKVEEPVRMETLDLKPGNREKSEKSLLKEQMAQAKVPVCFKDHIEKVLLESFLSYEEEERKEAMKKGDTPSHGLSVDEKSRESANTESCHSKTLPSPKNAISVQDIVDRVITQTEAINKNMSAPSSGCEGSSEGHSTGRHGVGAAHDTTQHQASNSAPRSFMSASGSTAASEGGYSNSGHHQHHSHHPHHQSQQQQHQQQQQHHHHQQHNMSQPMSSQDKALQEAQRHVVLKEHQSSTTTGRKRGRPRRVSPSTSSTNHHPHPHGAPSMADYRLSSATAGHHYPEDRSRGGHLPPPPLDYNPHGSLSFGLPPGVPGLLPPPPGAASLMRQHQMEQQRQQQQQTKDPHGHGSGAYPAPSSRGHQRETGSSHHMDMYHPRSHLPHQHHHHQHQHPTGTSGGSGTNNNNNNNSSSSSGGGGIKAPPPLILAENMSPGTRLVPVSHIPTKSCSCHSCVAHFSGPATPAVPPETSGSPAAQQARLAQQAQHQQSLRPGGGNARQDGRETSRSPHHLPSHGPHSHPAYGAATGPYPVASAPSSSAPSRHSLPPSAKDYYNQAHMAAPRGGESLRPVASMSNRGLPPQAIIPTFVAAQRQQLHREHGTDGLTISAPSQNQPQHYPREGTHPRYYGSKPSPSSSSSSLSAASTASSSSTPSTNSYHHHYPPSSQHHGQHQPPPNTHSSPHHPRPHHHQLQRHPSPSSQHHKHTDHRYPPEQESPRHHPDYSTSSSGPAYPRYDQRSTREHGPGASAHGSAPSASSAPSPRGAPNLPPPGGVARPPPAPLEPDSDGPLDLSVKPSRKPAEHGGPGPGGSRPAPALDTVTSHRTSSGPHGPDTDLQHGRGYRRHSSEFSDGRPGSYKHPGEYREAVPGGHQPHYLQTLENSVDRILPQHHHHSRSSYPGQHHSQQQQQQHHSHSSLPPPGPTPHHPHPAPHLRVSVSPHGSRLNPDPQHPGAAHPMDHHLDRATARPQHSPSQSRGYPPHVYPASANSQARGSNPAPGGYPHYPLSSGSPSIHQHPHAPHPHIAQAQHQPPPPLPPPPSSQQHYTSSQSQHHNKSSSCSGRGTAASPSAPSYYNRSPVLGRPQTVSPASAGGASHHYTKPHDSFLHGAFPPPPQSNSPYQRPPSHNQEGDNSRPSPVNSSHLSAGPPPPLTRRPSDTPSPDEEEMDAQGKLNISKHEPIQNIIGNHSAGDILYLICRLCRHTYGNPYGFRKHFRKEHGFEPKSEHTVVQTISATKSAMAHPPSADHTDGNRGGLEKSSLNELPSHPVESQPYKSQPCPPQHPHGKQEESVGKDGPRYFNQDHRTSESLPSSTRSEVLKDQKLLECAECSQTFQLNDFGAYKRHCRQHGGGSGSGPFLWNDGGLQSGKPWGPSSHHPQGSLALATSGPPSGPAVSSSWSTSTVSSLPVPASRRSTTGQVEPQHPVVHTPRDLQVEKLPADPAVMTASPDSSNTDEKLCADSQTSKPRANSSQSTVDSVRQRDRDLDSNSNSPSRVRETVSARPLSSPLAKQSRESGSSSTPVTPTAQPLSLGKPSSQQSDSGKSKEDNESISSDRCASVDSNSQSFEGSRTSSPAPDEPDFHYKHKKYSRYNRKRSTETSSLPGEPGPKSARSSSAESNSAASSGTVTSTLAQPGGKHEHKMSPVVTSSASNNARDCESSTSSSHASQEDSGRSVSPSSKTSLDNYSATPWTGKRGDDPELKKSVSSEENHKGVRSSESLKKRRVEDDNTAPEERSGGKRCSGNSGAVGGGDSPIWESGKFKWERMTRSQMGKTSVSYSSN